MKRYPGVVTTIVTSLATVALSAQQPGELSIPQQLKATGGFERVIVTSYEPLQLADLVGQADVIVEASTMGGRSFLAQNDTEIFTDYPFQVHSVIKNSRSPELRVGHTIVVRRNSGGLSCIAESDDDHVAILGLHKSASGSFMTLFRCHIMTHGLCQY